MAWRTFQSRVRRGSLTLALAAAFAISCGDGTGPAPLEPLVGALQVSAASPSGWVFLGESYYSATAILLYQAQDVEVTGNQIGADTPVPMDEQTDVGVYAFRSGIVNVMNNYIGRHADSEAGNPCGGRSDARWTGQDPPAPVPADKCDPDAVGVYFFGNSGTSKVVANRFSGNWLELAVGADRDHHNRIAAPTH